LSELPQLDLEVSLNDRHPDPTQRGCNGGLGGRG
jgi:hypothetical protein